MHLFEVIIEDSPEAVDFCYIYNFLLIVIICCPLKSFTIGIGCHFQKFVPIFDLMVEHKNFQLKKSIKEYFIHTKLHLQSSDIRSPQSYAKNGFPTHMLLLLRLTLLSGIKKLMSSLSHSCLGWYLNQHMAYLTLF